MTAILPASAELAWWLTAWLRGHVPTDAVLDRAGRDGVALHADGDGPPAPLLDGLALLRRASVDGVGLALPVEGDPLGVGGPPSVNELAVAVGECVTGPGFVLVPERVGASVLWRRLAAQPATVPDVGEADRGLRSALLESARRLADLDVARWRPDVADALADLRRPPTLEPPAGTPPRCVELAARGLRARAVVALAAGPEGRDHGAAVTAYEMQARAAALADLDRAARRALVAAATPAAWPPA